MRLVIESSGREDAYLTPDQARHLASHLRDVAVYAADFTE